MRDSEREPFYDDKTPSTGCGSECVQVYKCLHNTAPGYLLALCQPVSGVPGRRHLRSAGRGELDSPPVSICPRTGDRRLPTPVLHPGTRCPTISRTLIFPFNLSKLILRHYSFPHELAHLSAFEISYKNALCWYEEKKNVLR